MLQFFKFILFIAAVGVVLVVLSGFYFEDLLTPQSGFFVSADKGLSWQRHGVLATGGNISRLDVVSIKNNPLDSRILYAGTLNNGVFKSVDSGSTWHKLSDANKALSQRADVYSVAVDPKLPDYKNKKPDRFYLGVFQNDFGRVLKTEDGGLSFKEVYTAPRSGYGVFAVEVDPAKSNMVWAGTGEGILLKSQDYGESWKLVQEFGVPLQFLVIDPRNASRMFVSSFNGSIFSSADGGATWVDETEGLADFPSARFISSLVYNNINGRLYLTSRFGILESPDFGITWRAVEVIFPADALPFLGLAFAGRASQEIYASAGNLVYTSKDGGKFWQVRRLGTARKIRVLWVDPNNQNRVIAGAGKTGWK